MDLDQAVHLILYMGAVPLPLPYAQKRIRIRWRRYQDTRPSKARLRFWFRNREVNVALVTGWKGLTVIDFDDVSLYGKWLRYCSRRGGVTGVIARQTFKVRTRRGVHVYVRLPRATRSRSLVCGGARVGIDIKSRGGYVLFPPSVHPSGVVYRVINPGAAIFTVATLSAILPPPMLIREPPRTSVYTERGDPWQVAEFPSRVTVTDELVSRIRQEFRVEDMVEIKKHTGKGWAMALCPFHDDHNPSLSVNLKDNWVLCFAGCTPRPLDVIDLYAALNDLGRAEAIQILGSRL